MKKIVPEHRPRVNYGSEFLYTAFDATGYHFNDFTKDDPDCSLRNVDCHVCSGNLVRQLHRVQAINYGFTMSRKGVNEFGKLGHLGRVPVESPNVTLDFEYFLADGYNEMVMGFVMDGEHQAFHHHLTPEGRIGSNFFINVAPDGRAVFRADLMHEEDRRRTIGIGNAFLSQYAVTAEVGSIPKARVSFEALNMTSYVGICNLPLPSLDVANDSWCPDIKFSLPDTYESFLYHQLDGLENIVLHEGVIGLKPGDIQIDLDDAAMVTKQLSGFDYTPGAANIQGFTINVPIGHTKIHRLGRRFEFGRTPNFPSNIQIQVKAIVADLKKGSTFERLCTQKKHNLTIKLHDACRVHECSGRFYPQDENMVYYIKNAVLDQESFSSSISDNKIVDLNFTAPIASKDDTDNGLFIFGKSYFPERPALVAWGNPVGGPIGMYPPPSKRKP